MGVVFPFGKYKDQSVMDVASVDPGYLAWFSAQPGMTDKVPAVMEAIDMLKGGADRTPEHNKLQARFLEEAFRHKVCACIFPLDAGDVVEVVSFEKFCDVMLGHSRSYLAVEIKPTVGDDYPKIMRQMAAQRELATRKDQRGRCHWPSYVTQVLFVQANNSSLSNEVLSAMFKINDIDLVIAGALDATIERRIKLWAEADARIVAAEDLLKSEKARFQSEEHAVRERYKPLYAAYSARYAEVMKDYETLGKSFYSSNEEFGLRQERARLEAQEAQELQALASARSAAEGTCYAAKDAAQKLRHS